MARTAAPAQPVLMSLRVLPLERKAGGPRKLHWVASTSDVARDGGIIEAPGWQVDEFLRAHPSILWCHDWHGLPLGSATRAWVDDADLHFEMQFAEHEFAQTVERMVLSDPPHIRACSVGFDVLETRKPSDDERKRGAQWVATKTRLNEISLVPVPADPGAVFVGSRMRRSDASVIRRRFHLPYWETIARTIERTAMNRAVKATDDGMLVAEVRPAGDFEEGSFESMPWEGAEGVAAVVGVLTEDESVAVQGLEFDAEAFDAETAQAWLDENEDAVLEWRGDAGGDDEDAEGDPDESDEEMDGGQNLTRDQVRAAVDKVREAALALTETADELESLVDGDEESESESADDGRALAEIRAQIESLSRQVQDLVGERGSGGDAATRPDASSEVEDPYGLLAATTTYAGD